MAPPDISSKSDLERRTAAVLLAMASTGRSVTDSLRERPEHDVLIDNSTMIAALLLWMHDPMRPGELAEMMGITTGGSTKVVNRLEKAGFVTKEQDVDPDGRAVVVSLTRKGRGAIRSAIHASADAIRTLLAQIEALDLLTS
jgi:DNA-binding MarR family transcriptional regulator